MLLTLGVPQWPHEYCGISDIILQTHVHQGGGSEVQPKFNGSNTFGTMKICSRQGQFELKSVYQSARSGGIIGIFFSIFFNMKVCCVFSLESPYQGDSNEYTQHTIIKMKKKKKKKKKRKKNQIFNVCGYGSFS